MQKYFKLKLQVFGLALAFGLGTWLADAVLDRFIFPEKSYLELVFWPDAHDFQSRLLAVAYIALFGVIVANLVARYAQAREELLQSQEQLEEKVKERTARLKLTCERLRQQKISLRQTKCALEANEERLRLMFEESPAVKMLIDTATGAVVDANPAACRFYGYAPDELRGMNIAVINSLPPDERLKMMDLVLAGGQNHFTFQHRLASGEIRDVELFACPLCIDGNQLAYCIINDITERHQAEQALRESEARYRMLFNNANDSIAIIELRNGEHPARIEEINDIACSVLEYTREGLLHTAPWEVVAPEYREDLSVHLSRLPEEGHTVFETTLLGKDGGRHLFEVNAHLFTDKGKRYVFAIARDISERKRAEAALMESSDQLRRLSKQLISAQEKERAVIAREMHDSIGQTLTAIKFTIENMAEKTKEACTCVGYAPLQDLVPIVQQAIDEVRRICTELRPSLLDDFGIITTIKWFCREFSRTYPHIHVAQEVEVEEGEVPDLLKTVIYRILQEALHNIVKHSHADRVELSLRKTATSLELRVQDNGCGFDPGAKTKPLPTEMETFCNSGMGISSMRERAELTGGNFKIESAPAGGTLVRADWPL